MTSRGRLPAGVVALLLLSLALVFVAHRLTLPARELVEHPHSRSSGDGRGARETREGEESGSFPIPSGKAAALSCAQARQIVQQIRATLPYVPRAVQPSALAVATADWLDPYGLWSEAPDSPVADALREEAPGLLRELEDTDPVTCSSAAASSIQTVAVSLAEWTHELSLRFDAARDTARHGTPTPDGVDAAATDAVFDDETRPATEIAALLGTRLGRLEQGVGAEISSITDTARERFFPPLTREGWGDVVRAAALRAYLPLVDPHGAWAPVDEEASVYDVDLDPSPPDTLWDDGVRTALGVLVQSRPVEPLLVGDVVVSVAGVPLVGLPPEQLSQLVYATTDAQTEQPLVVLRQGDRGDETLRTLTLPPPVDGNEAAVGRDRDAPDAGLDSYRVSYGDGDALVIEIHEVRADLGDELVALLRGQKKAHFRRIVGLVLDLRGNGGGATDGALSALGLFLPGAPLFPMAHRDGSIELDRAPEPAKEDRWPGPVAALVDRDTASAAEMIAGALMAYHRGQVVGEQTFGKGCAQECIDDEAGVGVLKLTTLLYALPDGSPVQQVGLEPSLLLPSSASATPRQREADELNAPPTWRGPDVRDPTLVGTAEGAAWPDPHGRVGFSADDTVAVALRGLSIARGTARRRLRFDAGK